MRWISPLGFLILPFWLQAQLVIVNPWRDLSEGERQVELRNERGAGPVSARSLILDNDALLNVLLQKGGPAGASGMLELPLPDGRMATFELTESPVMEPELAKRYPGIRTFKGESRTPGVFSTRLDWTTGGFHAIIHTTAGTVYIDPERQQPGSRYQSYFSSDYQLPAEAALFRCEVEGQTWQAPEAAETEVEAELRDEKEESFMVMRTYRLAMASTAEFTQYHGGTVERALSAIVTIVNRLNQVFERDLAVRVILVGKNDQLIFTDAATDPYTNGEADKMLDENTTAINQRIGLSSYDLGHVLGTNPGVSGIALLGSVCSSSKGAGASTIRKPEGDPFTIAVVAHEMGHQFDANHSFSNCHNVNPGTGYEPGGGTTIMSYAGLCGNQVNNLQYFTDDYYHVISLQEILNHTRNGGGNGCPVRTPTKNRAPSVKIPQSNGFFIPRSTPFELSAQAEDPDGDELTYCWEEFDLGPEGAEPGAPKGNAPLFRSLPPSESPKRSFPAMSALLDGKTDRSEVLPPYSRNLNFRCTVRDNNPDAGAAVWAQVSFRSDSTAGPFRVKYPNQSGSQWKAGEYTEVRWDVANTNNSRVNCLYVNILLSIDGGNTYPITLMEMTPNDGSCFVTVPYMMTNKARVRIEAADNIFFDISDQNFEIWPPSAPGYTVDVERPTRLKHCLPDPVSYQIQVGSTLGYNQPLTFKLEGNMPEEASYQFSENPVSPAKNKPCVLTIDLGTFVEDTFRLKLLIITPNRDTSVRDLMFVTVSNDYSRFRPVTPADGTRGIRLSTPFNWTKTGDAAGYDFELATSPAFGSSDIARADRLADTTYTPNLFLEENRLYFWRVRPVNECGPGPYSATQSFQTSNNICERFTSKNVPVNISGRGLPIVESTLFIEKSGVISDLNIPLIQANYQPVKSLRISLVSPAGTEVVVFDRGCGNTIQFAAGFDDDAPKNLVCPPDDKIVFKPLNPLAKFIGENTFGTWKLRVEVVTAGFGASGAIDGWSLEFCASFSPSDPVLVTKDTLFVPPGLSNPITKLQLEAKDADHSAADLDFTLIGGPSHGYLLIKGDTLRSGDGFTQQDINERRLKYSHDGSETDRDAFTFYVTDGDGGWLPGQRFDISIDEGAVTANSNPWLSNGFEIFPNPVRDELHMRFDSPLAAPATIRVLTAEGRLVLSQRLERLSGAATLGTEALPGGVYLVSVWMQEGAATRKVVIIRQ